MDREEIYVECIVRIFALVFKMEKSYTKIANIANSMFGCAGSYAKHIVPMVGHRIAKG